MNKDMRDQFSRMKQAWTDHDPKVDKVNNCLPEIARIVSKTEVEVKETLKVSKRFMNTPSVNPNLELQTTNKTDKVKNDQKSERHSNRHSGTANEKEVTNAGTLPNHAVCIRKVDTGDTPGKENRPTLRSVPAMTAEKIDLGTVSATVERLMVAQDKQEYDYRKETEENTGNTNREEPGAHKCTQHSVERNAGHVRR